MDNDNDNNHNSQSASCDNATPTNDNDNAMFSNDNDDGDDGQQESMSFITNDDEEDTEDCDHFYFNMSSTRLKQPRLKQMISLDNGSTDVLFCKDRLLQNVRNAKDGVALSSNGGTITTNTKGHPLNLGDKWVNKNALTNTVSFAEVECK